MARIGGFGITTSTSTPIIERFTNIQHTTVIVGTSPMAIPAINMSYRQGMFVQNNHASNGLYVGGCVPAFICGTTRNVFNRIKASGLSEPIRDIYTFYNVKWVLSTNVGATNEWYAVASTGSGTPSITQPTIIYYATVGGGAETLGTSGTVGTLGAQHTWGWGDGDTLGYSTLYVRTAGATDAYNPALVYDFLMLYPLSLTADTTAVTGGLKIAAGSNQWLTLDGTCRLFGIASGASTPVAVFEAA